MSDIKKFQLMAEAAIAVAASDGLEDSEIDTVRNIVLNVTFMSNEVKSFFDSQGIEHNNVNFDDFGEAYDYILNKDILEFQSIELLICSDIILSCILGKLYNKLLNPN